MRRLLEEFRASERHVCELMAVPRSSGRYRSRRDDRRIQQRLRELAREHPRFGYRRLHLYLHREMGVNHKKVQRVYRELGLSVKRTRRRHLRRSLLRAACVDSAQAGVGARFRQRCNRRRTAVSCVRCHRRLHATERGSGCVNQFPQPACHAGTRTSDCCTRQAPCDSL